MLISQKVFKNENMPESLAKKILIVEDDLFLGLITQKYLSKLGFEVATEVNGQLGLDHLHATDKLPDLILTDIMMPIMNGLEFLENIKKDEKYKNIPVYAITSMAEELMEDKKNIGFEKIIIKPFSLLDLSIEINTRLKKEQ